MLVSPRIEIGHRVHDPASELPELRPSADDSLLFKRARRETQICCCLVVCEISLGLYLYARAGGDRPHRLRTHEVYLDHVGELPKALEPGKSSLMADRHGVQGRYAVL